MKILRQKEFGLFDVLRDLADKANKKIDPNYKTEAEILKDRSNQKSTNERELENKFANLSRQHKVLLEIYKKPLSFFQPGEMVMNTQA